MTSNISKNREISYENLHIRMGDILQTKNLQSFFQELPSYATLIFIKQGNCDIIANKKSTKVSKNHLLLLHPKLSSIHAENFSEDFEWYMLKIEGVTFLENKNYENQPFAMIDITEKSHDIIFFLTRLLEEKKITDDHSIYTTNMLLQLLLITILREIEPQFFITISNYPSNECQLIEEYIDTHFREDITLDTLSDLTSLNKYYIGHLFKSQYGISPMRFLSNRRLSEAKLLLVTTNLPISKIAELAGFTSQSYFSQVFRKQVQISPLKFRSQSTVQFKKNPFI